MEEQHLALQDSQGTDSFLQNSEWWLLSFNHSCLSWSQSQILYIRHNALLQKSYIFLTLDKTRGLRGIWLLEENLESQNAKNQPQIIANGCETREEATLQLLILYYFHFTIQRAKCFSTHKTHSFSSIYDNDIPEKARKVSKFTSNLLHIYIFWLCHRNMY